MLAYISSVSWNGTYPRETADRADEDGPGRAAGTVGTVAAAVVAVLGCDHSSDEEGEDADIGGLAVSSGVPEGSSAAGEGASTATADTGETPARQLVNT